MEVVVGAYSHLIFGYYIKPNEEGKLKFTTSFTNDTHAGCVKCVAVSSKGILASGSNDESIQLLKLQGRRTEIGSLRHHSGSVVSLKFLKNSHLFSASEDGTIVIWKVGSWDCQKILKHKKPILDFAIHPSGKLLLSTCKDRTLQTWDLVSGKRAFIVNLKDAGEQIIFSDDGELFIIVSGIYIFVYSTVKAEVLDTFTSSFKVSSVVFLKPRVLLVGGERGMLSFYDLKSFSNIFEFHTKTTRVKSMAVVNSKVVITSSDGYLKLYDVTIKPANKVTVTFVTGIVANQRWLCVCALADAVEKKKDKKEKTKSKKDSKKLKQKQVNKESDDEKEDDDDDNEDDDDDNEDEVDDDNEDEVDDKGEKNEEGDDDDDDDDEGGEEDEDDDEGEEEDEEEMVQ